MQARLEKIDDGKYALHGELSMQTVPGVAQSSRELIDVMSGEVTIDLSQVVRADSAGLALLIEWMRNTSKNGVELHFEQLPEQLIQIAKVSELHQILPIKT